MRVVHNGAMARGYTIRFNMFNFQGENVGVSGLIIVEKKLIFNDLTIMF